jgi:cobalt/nickel transport system permease protein
MALATFVERYEARASAVHRVDARTKVPATLLFILGVTLTPEGAWTALALLWAAPFAAGLAARLSPWFLLRRSFLALPFVLAAVPLLFTRPGDPLFTLPVTGWEASREGATAVVSILARSWTAVLAAALLTATTPVPDLLRALRWMRVPRILVATVYFTYRYLLGIGDEAMRMMRARDSRSAALEGRRAGRSVVWRARILGHMVGSLFVRSLERSERVYAAMQARGYAGELRFLPSPPVPATHWAAAGLVVAYAAAVQAGTRLL